LKLRSLPLAVLIYPSFPNQLLTSGLVLTLAVLLKRYLFLLFFFQVNLIKQAGYSIQFSLIQSRQLEV
jgi:hypothetical protein